MSWAAFTRARGPRATISVYANTASSGRSTCKIGLSGELIGELGWTADVEIGLLLGEGEDAGRLRMIRGGKPAIGTLRTNHNGGGWMSCGHLPFLGDARRLRVGVETSIIDKDTLELRLPVPGEGGDINKPAPPRTATTNGHSPTAGQDGRNEIYGAIKICLQDEKESIRHKGREIEVTARQGKVLSVLAKATPQLVGFSFIIDKVWGARPPASAQAMLDQIAVDLGKALPEIGLSLWRERGSGLALRIGGAA